VTAEKKKLRNSKEPFIVSVFGVKEQTAAKNINFPYYIYIKHCP
jgi:hypothetical protein